MNFVETPNQHPSVGVLTGVDFRAAASVNLEEASNGALSCEDLAAVASISVVRAWGWLVPTMSWTPSPASRRILKEPFEAAGPEDTSYFFRCYRASVETASRLPGLESHP